MFKINSIARTTNARTTNTGSVWSLTCVNYMPGFFQKYKKQIEFLVKNYVFQRDNLFAKLKRKGIQIPEKTPNGTYLIEHLYSLVPDEEEKLKNELKKLIKLREYTAAHLVPIYRGVAKNLLKAFKVNPDLVEDYRIESAIYKAAVRSLDRTKRDRIGVRSDFAVCLIKRAIYKVLEEEKRHVSIEYGREAEEGVPEHTLGEIPEEV